MIVLYIISVLLTVITLALIKLMNALDDLKGAVYDLQTAVGLAVQALSRPVVPADEVQAQANAIKNAVDSLRQALPPIPPS